LIFGIEDVLEIFAVWTNTLGMSSSIVYTKPVAIVHTMLAVENLRLYSSDYAHGNSPDYSTCSNLPNAWGGCLGVDEVYGLR
jgi:hypothetical protein